MRVKGAIADYLKRIKHPYYIALRHRIHGEFQKAWGMLPKIKNPKLRAHIETILLLEEHNVNEAEKAIKNINVKSLMNFYYAIVAIIKQDWDNFDKFKNMVKKNGLDMRLKQMLHLEKANMMKQNNLAILLSLLQEGCNGSYL